MNYLKTYIKSEYRITVKKTIVNSTNNTDRKSNKVK